MHDLEQRIARIHNDREHGSRWLVREAISILYDLARIPALSAQEHMEQIRITAQALAHARPAMAALAVAVGRILGASSEPPAVAQTAAQLLEDYDHAIERITLYAQPFLTGTVMTHSLSGTVLAVLSSCSSQLERVIVLEGRPRYEGRDIAHALADRGIAVTLITDAQAALFLSQCQAVVIGADSVLANGDVLNKAGTALLGWAAHGYRVPFYVLCETLKISPQRWSGDWTQLEEKEAEEVLKHPIAGVAVRNFYFDHTPARLVTKLITEQGILGKQTIRQLASRARRDARMLA